jgi:hypothetical protein
LGITEFLILYTSFDCIALQCTVVKKVYILWHNLYVCSLVYYLMFVRLTACLAMPGDKFLEM